MAVLQSLIIMPSKFSKVHFFKKIYIHHTKLMALLAGISGVCYLAKAQTLAPTPTVSSKPPQALVRFWNMMPGRGHDTLEVLLSENKSLTLAAPLNYYANYLLVQPGSYIFTVRRPSAPTNLLKRLPLSLPADSYTTILAFEKDGQMVVQAINDTIDPKLVSSTGRLVLRQFIPGAHVIAAVGSAPPSPVLNYGDAVVLEDLPTMQGVVNVQATFDGKPPAAWTVPVDFTTDHHASLLIMADSYGRFRPRLTVDGHAIIESAPDERH